MIFVDVFVLSGVALISYLSKSPIAETDFSATLQCTVVCHNIRRFPWNPPRSYEACGEFVIKCKQRPRIWLSVIFGSQKWQLADSIAMFQKLFCILLDNINSKWEWDAIQPSHVLKDT